MTIHKLGILKTDDIREELQSKFGSYPNMFESLFRQVAPRLQFITYDVAKEEHPDPIDECDAYLITGSKAGVYDDLPWISSLKQLVRDLAEKRIPLAGICFGHQVIAASFGGEVIKSPAGWGVGVHEYRISRRLNGLEKDSSFRIIATHQDQVVQAPERADILAHNEFCPIAGLISHERNYISFQGHPEFTKEYFLDLLNHLKEVSRKRSDAARTSMSRKIHPQVVAKSILDFLNSRHIERQRKTPSAAS